MGHIKEPKGVDFVINGGSLSKKQEEEVSRYILEYKKSKAKKTTKQKASVRVPSSI